MALVTLSTAALFLATGSSAEAAAKPAPPLRIGSLTVPKCAADAAAYCTTVALPFDYADASAGTIDIGFRWYPAASGGTSAPVILATEGGPGYPTSGSADGYTGLFAPLMADHNLLMVDLRGTGVSGLVVCKPLQNWTPSKGAQAYINDVGACGDQLNSTYLRADGSAIHAADLFTSASSARDVAALLGLLGVPQVDFYGDSYGTYFGQTFTARYPGLLRSVTLDAAYPVSGTDPFYSYAVTTAHSAFDLACHRSAACDAATAGSSWTRIGTFLAQLRVAPVTGATEDPDGVATTATVGPLELAELVGIAGSDSGVYKDLDPAIRAAQAGDDAPLLRLAAQELTDEDSGAAADFSAGLYAAVTCNDYPQAFGYGATNPQRLAQYNAAVAALPADKFAPFTRAEWTTNDGEEFDSCLKWPAPANNDPPVVSPTPYAPANVPVLVLSGDLDSLTTPHEGQQVAADMGPQARWILFQNDTHVNALYDSVGCASSIVRQFVANPPAVNSINTSCATHTPDVRVYGNFPTVVANAAAATAGPGNHASTAGLRLATIGENALGDAIWHWYYASGAKTQGLRGGRVNFTGSGPYTLTFHNVKWTTDSTVNGTATWNQTTGAVSANLTVAGPGGTATVTVGYYDYAPHSVATIGGSYLGQAIAATAPAP